MSVLALTPAGGTAIGDALACVGRATLARRAGAALVEVDPGVLPALIRALAFAGIDARALAGDLPLPTEGLMATGTDLTPVSGLALDVVDLRRIALGRATREVRRGHWWGLLPLDAPRRARCRALLRGEDVAFAWARRAWGPREAMRAGAARRSLRPVIFDTNARSETVFAGRLHAADGALAAWLFA